MRISKEVSIEIKTCRDRDFFNLQKMTIIGSIKVSTFFVWDKKSWKFCWLYSLSLWVKFCLSQNDIKLYVEWIGLKHCLVSTRRNQFLNSLCSIQGVFEISLPLSFKRKRRRVNDNQLSLVTREKKISEMKLYVTGGQWWLLGSDSQFLSHFSLSIPRQKRFKRDFLTKILNPFFRFCSCG